MTPVSDSLAGEERHRTEIGLTRQFLTSPPRFDESSRSRDTTVKRECEEHLPGLFARVAQPLRLRAMTNNVTGAWSDD